MCIPFQHYTVKTYAWCIWIYFLLNMVMVFQLFVMPTIFLCNQLVVCVFVWNHVPQQCNSAAVCGHNFLSGRLWQIYESRVDSVSLRWDHYTPWRAQIENVSHWYKAQAIPVYVSEWVSDFVGVCVFVCQTNGPLCSVRVYLAGRGCGAAGFGVQTGHYFYLSRKGAHCLLCYINTHTFTFISTQICRPTYILS